MIDRKSLMAAAAWICFLAVLIAVGPISGANAQSASSKSALEQLRDVTENGAEIPTIDGKKNRGLNIGWDAETYVKELPSGAFVDRNFLNGTGYSGGQVDDMAELAKEHGVIIGARSTNVDSMRHIRDGKAVPKPVDVKAKTISQADMYLGARAEDKGLVGYFEPKKPVKSEVPAHLWSDVEKRYVERLDEYNKLRGSVDRLKESGKVLEKDGKLFAAVKKANGSVEVKPFAGDIDAVFFKDAKTGELLKGDKYKKVKQAWMGLDKPQSDGFLEDFKRAWSGDSGTSDYWSRSGAPGQHGAEANLIADLTEGLQPGTREYKEAVKEAKGFHKKLSANHWEKGEVVLEMHPDGHLRRGPRFTKDTPLPNLHDYERPRFASFADDFDDIGKLGNRVRQGLGSVMKGLEAVGNAASAVEVTLAVAQLKDLYGMIEKATDPDTPQEEAEELFKKIDKLRTEIAGTLGVFVVTELNPAAAAVYGTWELACLGNTLATRHVEKVETGDPADNAPKDESCLGRQKRAMDHLADWLEGATEAEENLRAHRCLKFKWAQKRGLLKPKGSLTAEDVCNHIKSGLPVNDMIELAPPPAAEANNSLPEETGPLQSKPPLTRNDLAKLPPPPASSGGQPPSADNLDKALNDLDRAVADAEKPDPACHALAEAVGPEGRIVSMSTDIENAFAAMQIPVDDEFRADSRAKEALKSDLDAAQGALLRAQRLAANRADQVCLMAKNGNGSEAQQDAAKEHIEKIRNLQRLVDAVSMSQADAVRTLRERMEGRKPLAAGANPAQSAFHKLEEYCSALTAETKTIRPRSVGAVAAGFWRTQRLLQQTKGEGSSKADRVLAEFRLAKYISRWNKQEQLRDACSANIGKLQKQCWDLGYETYNNEAERFASIYDEMESRRGDWTDELSGNLMALNRMRVMAADYLDQAKGCAKQIGDKKPTAENSAPPPAQSCKPAQADNEPRHIYVLCGKPSTIYSSCWSEHCKTGAEIKAVIGNREDRAYVKITKKMPCPAPEPSKAENTCDNPKTVYQYEPPAKPAEDRPSGEREEPQTQCAALSTRVDSASALFQKGRIKKADRELRSVLSDVAALPGASACSGVRDRAAGNAEKVGKVVSIMDGVKNVLTKCEPKGLNRYIAAVEAAKNVRLVALRNRMQRARPVAVRYDAGKDAFLKGDMGEAESQFRQALAKAEGAGGWTCENIKVRINANINRIDKLKEIAAVGVRAADACDLAGISEVLQRIKGTTNPYLDRVHDRLAAIPKKCEKKIGNETCQQNFGPYATMNASEGRQADGSFKCLCVDGYVMRNDDGSGQACVSLKTAREADQELRNKQCSKGHYAGPVRDDGSFFCLPTRATANAHCKKGHYAGKINSKGSFYCIPTKKQANADCRRLYPGKGAWAGKINSKGVYRCYWRTKPTARRQPQRNVPTYRPPANPCPGGSCVPVPDIPVLPF